MAKKSKKGKARKFHEERMAALAEYDPTDPERYMPPMAGLTSLGGKAGVTALIKAMQSAKHRLPRLSPQFTGADDWLKLSEQLARAKGRSALTALRPTAESAATAAEREMYRKVLKPLSAVTGATMLNASLAPVKRRREEERNLEEFIAGNEAEELREEQMAKDRELAEMLALSSIDIDGMSPEIQALIEAEQAGGYAHGGTLTGQADMLSRAGRGDDTMLMHVTPDEVAGLASLAPGMMTINPETGLPEAGWFRNLLGTAAPFLMAMIPGVGPVLAGAMGGGLGSLIKGGSFKDALLGAGLGALGGKVFGGMGEAGADVIAGEAATGAMATPEAFGQAMQGVGPEGLTDIATQAGITPDKLSVLSAPATTGLTPNLPGITMPTGTITELIKSGVDPSIAFSQAGVNPEQLGVFKEGLSGLARETVPKTFGEMSFGQKMAGIKGGGFGGMKDALMTPAGLGYITGTGLSAQHQNQQAYEDYLLAMEEQRKQRAKDIEAYYPENVPYAGGGSIYKNRYINGNWS